MEPIFRQSYRIRECDVDRYGRLKPSRILFFAQDTASHHCQHLSLTQEFMDSKGLFWAVLRHRVQITRCPRAGETISVETWPMPTTRSAYPRSTVAWDENGNELFRAISLWVLMDKESRSMVLPGKSGVDVQGLLRGSELSVPSSMALMQGTSSRRREVAFGDLDKNGHVNNCVYLDWVCDLLPSAFHKDHPVRELSVCYLSEAREGEKLSLYFALSDGPSLGVDALREGENQAAGHSRVFSVRMLF